MEWKNKNNALVKKYTFESFREAFGFISQVALIAEKMNHHPIIKNRYNKVSLKLTTFSEGDQITDKDWALAREIDLIGQ